MRKQVVLCDQIISSKGMNSMTDLEDEGKTREQRGRVARARTVHSPGQCYPCVPGHVIEGVVAVGMCGSKWWHDGDEERRRLGLHGNLATGVSVKHRAT